VGGRILTAYDQVEEISRPVPLQYCLDPVSVFRGDDGQPKPPVSQRRERRRNPIEESRLGNHHHVRMLNKKVSETDLNGGIPVAREGFQGDFQAQPDGPADGIGRGRWKTQVLESVGDAGYGRCG